MGCARPALAFLALIASLAVSIGGCGDDPHHLDFFVRAESEALYAEIAWVEVRIAEGECGSGGRELYAAGFRPGEEVPDRPPLLARGAYCFTARARNVDCDWVAAADPALEVELPQPGAVDITLRPMRSAGNCEACDRGVCVTGPDACDGGVCPPGCDGGTCPPECDGGVCPGACDPYPEEACPTCSGSGWVFGIADDTTNDPGAPSTAIDTAGGIHATWYDGDVEALVYGHHGPGYWASTTVDSMGDTGRHLDVAMDGQGGVHAVYYGQDAQALMYAYRPPDATEWSTSTITMGPRLQRRASIAVDADGGVHVAYVDDGPHSLHYVHRPAGAAFGAPETLDAVNRPRDCSVAVDGSGGVHVGYSSDTAPRLRYVGRAAGATWTSESPDPAAGDAGANVAAAVDGAGRVHLAYHVNGDRGLGYATREPGGGWTVSTATLGISGRGEIGLAVGADGTAHLSLQDDSQRLQYVSRTPDDAWSVPALVSDRSQIGRHSSIAVDGEGGVHIAYSDDNDWAPLYAYRPPGGVWETEAVTIDGAGGQYVSVAVDARGLVHVLHYDADPRELQAFCKDRSSEWEVEVVDGGSGSSVGDYSTVAVGPGGDVHIVYRDQSTEQLKGAHRSPGGTWMMEIIDPGPGAGRWPAMGVAPDGTLHLVYVADASEELRYITRPTAAAGGWSAVEVLAGDVDRVSLVVGTDGVVHVVYDDRGAGPTYRRRGAGVWEITAIPIGDFGGDELALAVSPSGGVHVAFESRSDLRHVELPAGSPIAAWLAEEVVDDNGGVNGERASISVDSSGIVHVAYSNRVTTSDPTTGATSTDWDLRYAVRDGGVWTTRELTTDGDVGERLGLAIDVADRIHVLFVDDRGRVVDAHRGP
jgi:hypothetical protein